MRRRREPGLWQPSRRARGGSGGLASVSGRRALWDTLAGDDDSPVGSPRAVVPGPGTLHLSELDGSWSLGEGRLSHEGQATLTWGDLSARAESRWGTSLPRAARPTVVWSVRLGAAEMSEEGFILVGCWPTTTIDFGPVLAAYYGGTEGFVFISDGGFVGRTPVDQDFQLAAQVRSPAGEDWFYRGPASNQEWILAIRRHAESSSQLVPAMSVGRADGSLASWRIWEGPLWRVRELAAVPSPVSGTEYPSEPDLYCEFTLSATALVPGAEAGIVYRRAGPNDYWAWVVRVNGAGSAADLVLREVSGGIVVERGAYPELLTTIGSRHLTLRVYGRSHVGWMRSTAAAAEFEIVSLYEQAGGLPQDGMGGMRVSQGSGLTISDLSVVAVRGY